MRHLTIFVFALMIACSRAPAPVHQDAGAPARDAGAAPAKHAPEPDPSSATAKVDAGARRARRLASSGSVAPPSPADPHVLTCVGRPYKDWPSVRDCIAAEAPAAMANAADAGHKLGAAARPDVAANPAWLVPAWYVNATTGNNTNTCVTSGSPCHDYGEIVNRWQTTSPVLGQGTVLNLLADDTTTLVIWNPIIVSGGRATILGATTTVATGTFGTVTPKLRTRTPNPLLQINLGANASIAQGMMLVDSTHAGVAWVDSCVSSVCTISQPLQTVVPTPIMFPSEVDSFTAGDSYTLQRPVKAYIGSVVPTTVQVDLSAFFVEYVEHVWGVDPAGSFCSSITHSSSLTKIAESRFDTAIAGDALPGSDGSLQNVMGADEFGTEFIQAGAFGFGGCISTLVGLADADVIFHSLLIGPQPPGLAQPNLLGFAYCDGGSGIGNVGQPVNVQGNVLIAAPDAYGASIVYGSCNYDIGFLGTGMVSMQYTPTATSTIVGTSTLTCSGQPFANAYDATVDPAPSHPARSLTLAALDQPVASGGFAGYARCDNGGVITSDVQVTAAPAAYVAPVPNGGTGRDAGCPDGSVYEGTGASTPPTCEYIVFPDAAVPTTVSAGTAITVTGTPPNYVVNNSDPGANVSVVAGSNISSVTHVGEAWTVNAATQSGAVSGVTGSSGVACSPTTGAVNCTNTGVTSLTAGSGISVSASTGGVTVSNTALFTNNVPSGATGFTSCAAGDFVQGNGTSPLQCTNIAQYDALFSGGSGVLHGTDPGSVAGQPLISGSTGTYPFFSTLGANGGGTGLNSSGAPGNVLTSNGSTWASQAAPVQLGGFIDYVTNTLSGVNTALQTVASVAESITYPRPVIIDVSWICYDGIENNGIVVGVNVDNNTSIPGSYQLNGGLGADLTGHGAGSNGFVFMSQHIYFGGLSTASHTFYFMAATSSTSLYAVSCTAQAVLHF